MKRLLLHTLIAFSPVILFGQAQDQNIISFSAGYDAGIHGTLYTSQYQNNDPSSPDTSAAGTQMFKLNGQYNIFKFLSAGFDLGIGAYMEDPENASAAGNRISTYALSLRLYPVNKDKFVWYFGADIGGSRLTINRVITFIVAIPVQYKWKSPHYRFDTGFNWYFTDRIGMNFGIGYSTHNFLMTYYEIDGEEQDLTNWTNRLKTKGVHLNLGLAFHL